MQLKGHVWALGYEYVSTPSLAIQILAPGWLVLPTLANPSESSIQQVLQGGVWSSFSFPSSHEIDADVALSGS